MRSINPELADVLKRSINCAQEAAAAQAAEDQLSSERVDVFASLHPDQFLRLTDVIIAKDIVACTLGRVDDRLIYILAMEGWNAVYQKLRLQVQLENEDDMSPVLPDYQSDDDPPVYIDSDGRAHNDFNLLGFVGLLLAAAILLAGYLTFTSLTSDPQEELQSTDRTMHHPRIDDEHNSNPRT